MRENCVQSMEKQVEAQRHEESKFWRALQPFPNQSSMQERESEKESNIHEIRKPLRNIRKLANCPRRNFASLVKLRMNFATPCQIFASQKEFRKPCETDEFRNPLRNVHVIFKYFCTDSVRFLSQDILCNYLFSPCNQLKIFLDIQDI